MFAVIDRSLSGAIPYPELLAYAQSLSAFTSAPPKFPDLSLPGQPAPPLFFPPFPNEEKMRRGHLNSEEPLGPLGETHSVGRRKCFPKLFYSSITHIIVIPRSAIAVSRSSSGSSGQSVPTNGEQRPTAVIRP